MNDLDLLIGEEQVEVALAALAGIGYEMDFQAAAGSERWYADLKRPHDVGAIDIHQSAPPGPAYFYRTSGNILEHSRANFDRPGNSVYTDSDLPGSGTDHS